MEAKTRKLLIVIPCALIAIAGGTAMAMYNIPFIVVMIGLLAVGIATGKIALKGNYTLTPLNPQDQSEAPKTGFHFTAASSFSQGADISEDTRKFADGPVTMSIGTGESSEENMRSCAYLAYGLEGPVALYAFFLPTSPLASFLVAWANRKKAAGTIYESHFNWIIRTYFIGLAVIFFQAMMVVAVFAISRHPPLIYNQFPNATITGMIFLPLLVLLWTTYRMQKGFNLLRQDLPIGTETIL